MFCLCLNQLMETEMDSGFDQAEYNQYLDSIGKEFDDMQPKTTLKSALRFGLGLVAGAVAAMMIMGSISVAHAGSTADNARDAALYCGPEAHVAFEQMFRHGGIILSGDRPGQTVQAPVRRIDHVTYMGTKSYTDANGNSWTSGGCHIDLHFDGGQDYHGIIVANVQQNAKTGVKMIFWMQK